MSKLIIASVLAGLALSACGAGDSELTYEIVETWRGGEGKAIVISPGQVNDEDMTALGAQLNMEAAADDLVDIFVFDDAQAAALTQKVLNAEESEAERAIHDQHYVGLYSKNSIGTDRFVFSVDGGTTRKSIHY